MAALFVFAYGSLVSPTSATATLGHQLPAEDGPLPAVLAGYAREWNVGSDRESHPERELREADGNTFVGTLAVLGLRPTPRGSCNGALYRVERPDLRVLRIRERNYVPVEVTDLVRGVPVRSATVITYVPSRRAIDRLRAARARGTAAVQRAYVRGVESAFAGLGVGELAVFRASTLPHGLEEREILSISPPTVRSHDERAAPAAPDEGGLP